ncbi:MAG: RsmB/NOP family class I SAM-dependent RNA methyltransferase, partial [Clostridia bacterium]|nr:RsmB/NOP family class I SAM-dependent RNA methyltransferase [Clostridia bacterium]
PANALPVADDEIALDLCAAPGGKAGQLARFAGLLVANEPNPSRAAMLAGNLERLGLDNCSVVSESPERLARKWPEAFDAILVDAPCSGEGMFRRDPDAIGEWSLKRVAGCAERQREILSGAVKMLRPSGRLLYSTCTFNRLEDEDNARWLRESLGLEPMDFSLEGAGASLDGCLKLWPHRVRGEGQFMALFRKPGSHSLARRGEFCDTTEAARAASLLSDALGFDVRKVYNSGGFRLIGQRLHWLKGDFPDMSGIKTHMYGLCLANLRKGYVLPDHALAMALPRGIMKEIEVDMPGAMRFISGQELYNDAEGWAIVVYRGMPLGFGKGSQGRVRNHLPKGIRVR